MIIKVTIYLGRLTVDVRKCDTEIWRCIEVAKDVFSENEQGIKR